MQNVPKVFFLALLSTTYLVVSAYHCQPLEKFHYGTNTTTIHCEESAPDCTVTLTVEMLQTMVMYEVFRDGRRSPRGHMAFINKTTGELCRADGLELFSNLTAPVTADGISRMYLAINGQSPGPTIIGYEGQVLQVRVVNLLKEDTLSLHWHGQLQRGNYWMDGVGHITQCPILPGDNFTYTMTLTESGTHWYHSHIAAQRTDGLYGAIIVRESRNNLKSTFIDDPSQHTLLLHDWYNEWSMDTFMKIHTTVGYYPYGAEGGRYVNTVGPDGTDVGGYPFWSALINGRGRHYHINSNSSGNNHPEQGKCISNKAPLHTFSVEHGKTYRMRIIGVQNNYAFRLSIQGHRFSVYATDGHKLNYTNQLVDFLIVNSGERYDILLKADRPPGRYWIRTETLEINAKDPCPHHHRGDAVLHYTSVDWTTEDPIEVQQGCTRTKPCIAVNCPFRNYPLRYNITCVNINELTPLHQETPPSNNPMEEIFLNFGFHGLKRIIGSTINGISFKQPSEPPGVLVGATSHTTDTYCNVDEKCKEGDFCHCTHMINIGFNSTVQLVLSNMDSAGIGSIAHPVHLHGHAFHVVGMGYPRYNATTGFYVSDNKDLQCVDARCTQLRWRQDAALTLDRPVVKKDTVVVPAGGYTVIRFSADNPGIWLLHCHIEAHHLEGMSLIINEAADLHPPTPPNFPQCQSNYEGDLSSFKKQQRKAGVQLKYDRCNHNQNDSDHKNNNNGTMWLHCAKVLVGTILVTSIIGHLITMVVVFRFSSRRPQRRLNFVLCVVFPSCTWRLYIIVSTMMTLTLLCSLIMLLNIDRMFYN